MYYIYRCTIYIYRCTIHIYTLYICIYIYIDTTYIYTIYIYMYMYIQYIYIYYHVHVYNTCFYVYWYMYPPFSHLSSPGEGPEPGLSPEGERRYRAQDDQVPITGELGTPRWMASNGQIPMKMDDFHRKSPWKWILHWWFR